MATTRKASVPESVLLPPSSTGKGAAHKGRALGVRSALALAALGLALLACTPALSLPHATPSAATPTSAPTSVAPTNVAPTNVAPTSVAATNGATPAPATPGAAGTPAPNLGGVLFVPGSSLKVCQLVGETDPQTNLPTTNQTETHWGLTGNDLGYAFEHDGKLFFLFGDSKPTRTFAGKPNGDQSPNRNPDDNDALAYTTDTTIGAPGSGLCPTLTFIHYSNGAFKNPVVLGSNGQPAITLRTNEVPRSGLSDGGHLYGFFDTDNYKYQPGQGGPVLGDLGYATRSVVAVSDDDGDTFHYLYDFSKGDGARFVNVASAQGQDGYIYFWGAPGGEQHRQSPPYLARKPAGTLGSPDGVQYFTGLGAGGQPNFVAGESNAVALFHDSVTNAAGQSKVSDCIDDLGVTWSAFLNRWLMLYNCAGGANRLGGVYLRVAAQPWGPWSDPQLIFNAQRDNAACHYIHRAVTSSQPQCDNLAPADRASESGASYAPYVLARYTANDPAKGTSTIYYTLSTWLPYTEVIMQTTLQRAPE